MHAGRFMRNARRASLITCAVAPLAVLAAGCGGSDSGGGTGGSGGGGKGKPIVFGIETHKTGIFAAVGFDKEYGVRAGVAIATNGTNQVAGRPIKFVVSDDGSDPGRSPQVVRQQLQQDHPDLVFGVDHSAGAASTAKITTDAQIPNIFGVTASDEITGMSPWVFRTTRNSTQEAHMGAAVVGIKAGQTFMILAPDYAYGQAAAKSWKTLLESQGGKQIGSALFAPLDGKDYTAVVERIRKEAPDKLIVPTFASASGPILWQAIGNAGIANTTEIYTLLPQRPVREAMGAVATKVHYFAIYDENLPDNALNTKFVATFKELTKGKSPDIFAGDSGVAGELAVAAIEKTGGDTSAEAIRKALDGLEGEGLKGTYRVRPEDHAFLQTFYEARVDKAFQAHRVKAFTLQDSEFPVEHPIAK